jgi:hypothetical protein
MSVLLPAPGGPVTPMMGTRLGCKLSKNSSAPGSLFSIQEMDFANSKKSPLATPCDMSLIACIIIF